MAQPQSRTAPPRGGRPSTGGNAPRDTQPPKTANLEYPKIAEEYGIDKPLWFALRNLYPGGQEASIVMVYEYCKTRQLDPLKKPVHIVPMRVKQPNGSYAMQDVIMPGIQELRTTAARTREFAGIDPPKFGPVIGVPVKTRGSDEDKKKAGSLDAPEWCEITVHRLVGGKRYGFTHIEYFEEAVARNSYGEINEMWSKRSRGQLAKCAEAGALRKAFPEELGGEYAAEELEGQMLELPELQGLPQQGNGASGIAGPEELPPAAEAPAATSEAKESEPPRDTEPDDITRVIPREEIEAARKMVAEEKANRAAADRGESDPAPAFSVKLTDGPLRIFNKHLQDRGIDAATFLARFGRDVEVSNINEALGTIRAWT